MAQYPFNINVGTLDGQLEVLRLYRSDCQDAYQSGEDAVRSIFPMVAIVVTMMSADVALACDDTIVLTNWKSCAVGPLSEGGGGLDWRAVPSWANNASIRPYFFDDPRMLALHGLCNTNFKRVVMCLLPSRQGVTAYLEQHTLRTNAFP